MGIRKVGFIMKRIILGIILGTILATSVNAGLVWTDCTIDGRPPYKEDGTAAKHCGLIYRRNIDQWFYCLAKKTSYAKMQYVRIKYGK